MNQLNFLFIMHFNLFIFLIFFSRSLNRFHQTENGDQAQGRRPARRKVNPQSLESAIRAGKSSIVRRATASTSASTRAAKSTSVANVEKVIHAPCKVANAFYFMFS